MRGVSGALALGSAFRHDFLRNKASYEKILLYTFDSIFHAESYPVIVS